MTSKRGQILIKSLIFMCHWLFVIFQSKQHKTMVGGISEAHPAIILDAMAIHASLHNR